MLRFHCVIFSRFFLRFVERNRVERRRRQHEAPSLLSWPICVKTCSSPIKAQ